MNKLKIAGILLGAIILYYCLQYGSAAVHYNCALLKDDCPPPIYGSAEIIYRVMVQPPWLDHFEIAPMTYAFEDGIYTFWAGDAEGKSVIIRVREDQSPTMEWIKEYRGIPIYPAHGEQVREWLTDHPEHQLRK